jgi:hypothetical protein
MKLKQSLLELARNDKSTTSKNNPKEQRQQLEVIMEELQNVRPFQDTASSPLLQKEWLL